jgi:hypothetical protein
MISTGAGMSRASFFRKVFDGNEQNQRIQSNIEAAVAQTLRSPLLDGRMISDITLVSGDNKLEHKLARKVRGYLVIDRSNGATIYTSSKDEKFLTLNASTGSVISLWVF